MTSTTNTISTRIPRRWLVSASLVAALAVTGACGGGKGQEQAAPRAQPAVESSQQEASTPTKPASSSSKGQSLDAENFDACALLTNADLASALGEAPTGPGTGSNPGQLNACDWSFSVDRKLPKGIQAQVLIRSNDKVAAREFNAMKANFTPNQPVTGLGEDAISYNLPGGFGTKTSWVTVLTGRAIVSAVYSYENEPPKVGQAQLVELAKKMLERIG